MAQITYANKVALNENPEIAAINKVSDDDMNEIKQVVNDNYNNTIQISNTQPSDSDWKIWIDNSEVADNTYYNDNGTATQFKVTAYDTLPVGAIVEYNGQTVPSGWADIGNNQIQKTSQYIEGGASLSNEYGTSNENGYTQQYINGLSTYEQEDIYNNENGTNASFQLTNNASDYDYLEVFFADAANKAGRMLSVKATTYTTGTLEIPMTMSFRAISGAQLYLKTATVFINGTACTFGRNVTATITTSGTSLASSTVDLYIYKIVGYKKLSS